MTRTLPPPLSAPPTVEMLETLYWGLQRPMRAGVPTPPPGMDLFDVAALERDLAEQVTTTWRVEHATSGVPVHVAVGDRLTVAQLDRLRWHLGVEIPAAATRFAPAAAEASPPGVDAIDDPAEELDASGAPLAWSAAHHRRRWLPLALVVTTAAAAVALLGPGVPLP